MCSTEPEFESDINIQNLNLQLETGSDAEESEGDDETEDLDEGIETENSARDNANKPKKLVYTIIRINTPRVDEAILNSKSTGGVITNTDRVNFIVNNYNEKHSPKIRKRKIQKPTTLSNLSPFKIPKTTLSSSPFDIISTHGDDTDNDSPILTPSLSSSSIDSSTSTSPLTTEIPNNQNERGRHSDYTNQKYTKEFSNENFELKIYSQRNDNVDDETGEKFVTLSKIRFLIHKRDPLIFALPGNFSRYVVQFWADTEFPKSVASAILAEHSTHAKAIKSLLCNRYMSKYRMRNKESLNQQNSYTSRFSPQICTSFEATVKNEEIRKVFNIYNNEFELKLKTGFDYLRFSVGGNIQTYASLCSTLWAIYEDPSMERSQEYQGYFTRVNSDVSEHLDFCLLKDLKELIFYNSTDIRSTEEMNGIWKTNRLSDFNIFQKNFEKYVKAEEYWVQYKKKKTKTFTTLPTFRSFCESIKHDGLLADVGKAKHGEFFKQAKIYCQVKNSNNPVKENFMACLEGIYLDNENQNYWRMCGSWYQVSSSYAYDVEVQFEKFLAEHLIKDNPDEEFVKYLHKPFPLSGRKLIEEGDYNKMYSGETDYILGDNICMLHNMELFDILQYFPNHSDKNSSSFFYYHIKKTFDAKAVRCVGSQLLQSASLIFNSFSRNTKNSALKLLHQKYTENNPDANFIQTNFANNFPKFQKESKNSTFVFAIAHERSGRSLERNYCPGLKISVEKIAQVINALGSKKNEFKEIVLGPNNENYRPNEDDYNLATEIFSLVKAGGYIDDGDNLTQKWSDTLISKKTNSLERLREQEKFTLPGLKTSDAFNKETVEKHIFTEIVFKLRSNFVNIESKIIMLSLRDELANMNFGFKIYEIPIENRESHELL